MIPSQSSTGSDKSSTVDKGNRHSQSKFYCATEEGDLIYADWINEKTGEDKGL